MSMWTPAGAFSYEYDAAGRMTGMTNPHYETTAWTYYDNDWLQTQQLSVGALTTYTYNARGQLTRLLNQLDGAALSDFTAIAYDGAGNRKSFAAGLPQYPSASGAVSYEYDAKDQLTQEQSARGGGYTHGFGYDAAGNPTAFKGLAKSYNANNQQTGSGFAHDLNGNPTTYNGAALTFDPENRLTSHGAALGAGYRGDGLRGWKQTSAGRTYFVYDGALPVVEFDPAAGGGEGEGEGGGGGDLGGAPRVNTFGAAGLVSRVTGMGPQGGVNSQFYTFDPQGSVAQTVSFAVLPWLPPIASAPSVYAAHGAAVVTSGGGGPWGNKARFGYYADDETGLLLTTYRYYDPAAGRFLTRDPISYNGGINLYGYTKNNPANRADPLGLDDADYPVGGGPSPNPWYWSHNESADNEGTPYYLSHGIPGAHELGIEADLRNFPRVGDLNWDPYDGAYRHCVSACILRQRYGPLAPLMVWVWDRRHENSNDPESRGDMMGEQEGLRCDPYSRVPCDRQCLERYPSPAPRPFAPQP